MFPVVARRVHFIEVWRASRGRHQATTDFTNWVGAVVAAGVSLTWSGVKFACAHSENADRQRPGPNVVNTRKEGCAVQPTVAFVVRHAERLDYVDRSWLSANRERQPWNPPLSEAGHRQASVLPVALDAWCSKLGVSISAVYSSPLLRALQTAQPVAAHVGHEIKVVPNLTEWLASEFYTAWACHDSTGCWGSGTGDVLPQYRDDVCRPAAEWLGLASGPRHSFLHPESKIAVTDRVSDCIDSLALANMGTAIVVVSHGGPVQFSAERLSRHPDLPMAEYAGIYVLIRDGVGQPWHIVACNAASDVGHTHETRLVAHI